MNSDTETTRAEVRNRPWAKLAEEMEPEYHHWSDYAAWERWVAMRESAILPAAGPILDAIDYDAKVNLYCMMCQLADGDSPAVSPAMEAKVNG